MTRRHGEAGFTLPEVLIAGTLTLLLALPAYELLRKSHGFTAQAASRFRMNEAARQVFVLAGSGSAVLDPTLTQKNARGFPYAEGLRSRQTSPAGDMLRSNSRFVLPDAPFLLQGDTFPTQTIACTGAGSPLPDCTAGAARTVEGWLGADPAISVAAPNAALSWRIADPFRATQPNVPAATATERYRTIFTLNVESPP
jgi:hypothetical protein